MNEQLKNQPAQFLPKEQWERALTHALQHFLRLRFEAPAEQAEALLEVKNSVGMVLAALRNEPKPEPMQQTNGEHKEEAPLPQ